LVRTGPRTPPLTGALLGTRAQRRRPRIRRPLRTSRFYRARVQCSACRPTRPNVGRSAIGQERTSDGGSHRTD
jgi:hypothetical protein